MNKISADTSAVSYTSLNSNTIKNANQIGNTGNTQAYNLTLGSESLQSVTYSKTASIITSINSSAEQNLNTLVADLLQRQGMTLEQALGGQSFNVDEQTQSEALDLISDDGYWGVTKTSDRIVEFAISAAGNDPSKFETIKEAINDGFNMAKELFGGELPEISTQTYDAIMEKLDSWSESYNQ